jgi:hypothetical protein
MAAEPNRTPASPQVRVYELAHADMWAVALVAKRFADLHPAWRYLRRAAEVGTVEAGRELTERDDALSGLPFLQVVETGLIVTYARPFTTGRPGFPITEKFVPVEKRELHKQLLDLRSKVYAHIDDDVEDPWRRVVERYEDVDAEGNAMPVWQSRPNRMLNEPEIRDVGELALAVADALLPAIENARADELKNSR